MQKRMKMKWVDFVVRFATCEAGGDMRYRLEFGRAVDLTTFESAFIAAKGYFRQMLTLRTLVADSFWQGFSAGAGELFLFIYFINSSTR